MQTKRKWLRILVLIGGGTLWSLRPSHSSQIQDADMVGVFVAQTGVGKFTLALNKNHALRSVLVEPSGYTLKQKTGWWKLVRQPDGQQQFEYDGIVHRCVSGDGSVCISGQGTGGNTPGMGVSLDKIDGKIVIYTDQGRFVKQ